MHLVELEDLPYCPAVLRDGATAYLQHVVRIAGHAEPLADKLADALESSGEREVLDLCSGGGGPTALFADRLRARGLNVKIRLSDLYPNRRALARVAEESGGMIDWEREPVDATRVPDTLPGMRLLCNSFHHFRPDDARRILADAVKARRPIAVFELVSREPVQLAALALSPLTVSLFMPFVRPFDWRWLPLTYALPALPLLVWWDGIVSGLRVYDERELAEMVASLDAPGFRWDIGRLRLGRAPVFATYLIGMPEAC